ncbi:MAG: class I SAM-dependent methyltransferase [Melioribacteraceae bacterium]
MNLNPWLEIPSSDYENHMSASNVGQLQVLNKIIKDVLDEFNPKSICILGCTTGNGFEHLINRDINEIVGIDINKNYLEECYKRFHHFLPQLKLICADLNDIDLHSNKFDLIHAALIFEYVHVKKVLNKIKKWLKHQGILCAVFQLPSENAAPVSETPYVSLKSLSSIMTLFDKAEIERMIKEKFLLINSYNVNLPQNKKFFVVYCKKKNECVDEID